jgi:hypothetical protein
MRGDGREVGCRHVTSCTSRTDAHLRSTYFRAALIFVADNQNITLSLPKALLKRVKRVAADRETSVSALMTEALDRLADEDRGYSAARKRALMALKSARSLGTQGRRTWSRDELHER